jgi:Ca2+/Na+ antiporter
MLTDISILILCAAVTVAAVRLLVMSGITSLCDTLRLSEKTEGQIIGYATSLPEFVVVVSAAFSGVFDAGFWNIASSNIINWILFMSAVFVFRQHRDLAQRAFIDEIVFGTLSVAVPLGMLAAGVKVSLAVSAAMALFFILYRVIDARFNPVTPQPPHPERTAVPLWRGILFLAAGIAVIIAAGRFLGAGAENLIHTLNMPSWLVGWILGLITSIPEMASFFEIFRLYKKRGRLGTTGDTQEALDALVASNMSNLGVILPARKVTFWIFS